MAVMQGADDIFWFWVASIVTVGAVLATWYYVIMGRDRKPKRQRRGEDTVERYGTIEEDRAPVAKFLILTYIGVAVWIVFYAIWTGINGLGV